MNGKNILLFLHVWSATHKAGEGTTYMIGGMIYPAEPDQIALGAHDEWALACILPRIKP